MWCLLYENDFGLLWKRANDTILKHMKVYKSEGTYIADLGTFLIKNGLKCKIVGCNPDYFAPEYKTMNNDKIIRDMKRRIKEGKILI
ncbi:MAG: hypothetical protein J7K68_06300 [Candidatus Diapherotrites archaeon]|nr:hypothetical protein [Candidatus Diapherotrites archaeon]